jgi:hypothetical protein
VQNGLLAGLPYLVMWIVMILSGLAADALRSKHVLSTTNVRKLFNAVGKRRTNVVLVEYFFHFILLKDMFLKNSYVETNVTGCGAAGVALHARCMDYLNISVCGLISSLNV